MRGDRVDLQGAARTTQPHRLANGRAMFGQEFRSVWLSGPTDGARDFVDERINPEKARGCIPLKHLIFPGRIQHLDIGAAKSRQQDHAPSIADWSGSGECLDGRDAQGYGHVASWKPVQAFG
jgi:hypothetical protein